MRVEHLNQRRSEHEKVDEDYCPTELNEEIDDVTFNEKMSSCTCRIDDIQGIIYGGQSSRFWMLRKHINTLPRSQLDNLPFYSWNCITLQLSNRDVDLVIRCEQDMRRLIKLLVYRMCTLDGNKNSALKLLNLMYEERVKQFKRQNRLTKLSSVRLTELKMTIAAEIAQKVCLKYHVITVRQKISFMAARNCCTILELFLTPIKKLYNDLEAEGSIVRPSWLKLRQDLVYEAVMSGKEGLISDLVLSNADDEGFMPDLNTGG